MTAESRLPKTILIAEDGQVRRESLAELLEDEGYTVEQAGDGRAACERVLEPGGPGVSDVRMPEMDGMELLEQPWRRLAHR
ncbi:MAG: response regulator [Phycisphaeraceae bacterium]